MKMMSVTYEKDPQNDEPFNNLRNSQILLQGVEDFDLESIIVCDSHYMDLSGSSPNTLLYIYSISHILCISSS